MRNTATLNSFSTITTTKSIFSPPPPPPAATMVHQSTVVPYLFGGLAAMLGLIALALLILACSYLRHSERNDPEAAAGEEKSENSGKELMPVVFEEKVLVIMAGDVEPTFLATPMMSTRASSFAGKCEKEKVEEGEKPEEDEERSRS